MEATLEHLGLCWEYSGLGRCGCLNHAGHLVVIKAIRVSGSFNGNYRAPFKGLWGGCSKAGLELLL